MESVGSVPNIESLTQEMDAVKVGQSVSNYLNNPDKFPNSISFGHYNTKRLQLMHQKGELVLDELALQELDAQTTNDRRTLQVPIMPSLRTPNDIPQASDRSEILLKLTDAKQSIDIVNSSYIIIDGSSSFFKETGWVITNSTSHNQFEDFIKDPDGFFLFDPKAPQIMSLEDARWYAGHNNHNSSYERSSILRMNMELSVIIRNEPSLNSFYSSIIDSNRRFFIDDGGARLKSLEKREGKPFH